MPEQEDIFELLKYALAALVALTSAVVIGVRHWFGGNGKTERAREPARPTSSQSDSSTQKTAKAVADIIDRRRDERTTATGLQELRIDHEKFKIGVERDLGHVIERVDSIDDKLADINPRITQLEGKIKEADEHHAKRSDESHAKLDGLTATVAQLAAAVASTLPKEGR